MTRRVALSLAAAAFVVLGAAVLLFRSGSTAATVTPTATAATALEQGASSDVGWLDGIEPVASPAPANSGQPQLTVEGERAILSWLEQAGTRAALKFSEWKGGAWSAPRTVASDDNFFVNWADVPSVRLLADGTLAAHWLQQSGEDPHAYDVRLSFSKDDGRTWTAPTSPHHDGTQSEHGFASLFQMPGAGLGLIWLDGRAMASATSHDAHGSGADNMSVRAAVFSPDGRQTSELVVDGRVCECCPTAAAVTSDGVIAAFRNRSEAAAPEDEIRDIYVSRFASGRWSEPVPVYRDNWRMPACPVNGPSLSASGKRVALAWFTMKEDQGQAFVAFSDDAGRTFGTPIRVDDNVSLGRVDVELLPDGAAAVSWIEFADQRAEFRVRRIASSGARSPAVTVVNVDAERTSGYPRLARVGRELIVAWVSGVSSASAKPILQVMTARARLGGGPAHGRTASAAAPQP